MAERRVFVFGSGRSGTTLLAKLIDSSPNVLYRHEPDKIRPSNQIPFLPEPAEYSKHRGAASDYLRQLFQERLPFVVGKRPLFSKAYRSPWQSQLHAFLLGFLGLAEKARLAMPVPDLTNDVGHLQVVKSVNSVCRVPLFSEAAPGIKFIHIVRHPGAVVASVLKGIEQGVMGREDYSEAVSRLSHARQLPVALEYLKTAGFAERTAYAWMVQNDKTFSEMQDKDNYMVVSYEDLCVNMTDRLSEICEFIGIELDPQMTRFIGGMNGADTSNEYFSVVRNPVAGIKKWEGAIDRETADSIASLITQSRIGRLVLDRYQTATASLP